LEILGFPCLIFVTVFVTIRGTMIDEVQIEALENLKEIFRLRDGLSVQILVVLRPLRPDSRSSSNTLKREIILTQSLYTHTKTHTRAGNSVEYLPSIPARIPTCQRRHTHNPAPGLSEDETRFYSSLRWM